MDRRPLVTRHLALTWVAALPDGSAGPERAAEPCTEGDTDAGGKAGDETAQRHQRPSLRACCGALLHAASGFAGVVGPNRDVAVAQSPEPANVVSGCSEASGDRLSLPDKDFESRGVGLAEDGEGMIAGADREAGAAVGLVRRACASKVGSAASGSGATRSPIPRDGGIQDLAEAERSDRRFDYVICESIERTARHMYYGTTIEHRLERAGVRLLAADEPFQLATVDGRKPKIATSLPTRRVKQSISEFYVVDMLEKSWDGYAVHTEAGYNIGKACYA